MMRCSCKKLLRLFAVPALFVAACLLQACSSEDPVSAEDRDFALYPDNGLAFQLFPNDMARNDSVASNLSHGAVLVVHPQASYELSFDADTIAGAPTLQLFRLIISEDGTSYRAKKVRSVSANLVGERFVYSFTCEENKMALWGATLEYRRSYYKGKTRNVRLVGNGSFSDHMSLNLVVVGNVASKLDGFTIDELSKSLLSQYRKYYSSVVIDTLYVRYANEHPKLGNKYPANEPWVAGRSSKDVLVSELGGWPDVPDALDLVLVHYIDEVGVLGYSNLFSGNMKGGEGSTVVLGAYVKDYQGQIPVTLQGVVETALHETGHFFGLRHSTASSADLQAFGDFSNYEDGFEDTPYCPNLLKSGLLKAGPRYGTDFKIYRGGLHRIKYAGAGIVEYDPEQCPDASNYMFPLDTDVEYEGFSPQQLATLRANLMIYPH